MSGNVIYRGPITSEPETLNLPVAGAYNPGILVTEDGAEFTVATGADIEAELLVLSNRRLSGQDITTAYVADETGIAYLPQPGMVFQCRLAAATYAKGDLLTVGASGYLEAALTTERVLATFQDDPATLSAGDFADVRIANSFNMA